MKAADLKEVKNYVSGNLRIGNNNLTSLEGCPEVIGGNLWCTKNLLTSFEHFPKRIIGDCYISRNYFTYFKDIDQHIEYIGGILFASLGYKMNITSGFSDLFGIDGLVKIACKEDHIQYIANKYLPEKDLINFQDEMIKAGYESYL